MVSTHCDMCYFHALKGQHISVLSGYITTLKIKQKLDVSSEGPSSRVSSRIYLSVVCWLPHDVVVACQWQWFCVSTPSDPMVKLLFNSV